MSKADEIMDRLDSVPDDGKNWVTFLVSVIGGDYDFENTSSAEDFETAKSTLSEAFGELEARAIPEGTEWLLEVWPKWSNGEYCKFGDWWTADRYGECEPRQFNKLSIYAPGQLREWGQDDGDSYGYEWDFMRPSELGYRPEKAERPDSWERIEEDVRRMIEASENGKGCWCEMNDYVNDRGIECPDGLTTLGVIQDIVRRCKALAEKEPR